MKEILLTQGLSTWVDDSDYLLVSQYSWHPKVDRNLVYVHARVPKVGGGKMTLHRFIMGNPKGLQIDHVDGNPLNNTRINLRVCTPSQNAANRKGRNDNKCSKYKGVTKSGIRWQALVNKVNAGVYDTQEEAALAYNVLALQIYGEFANLNIVGE